LGLDTVMQAQLAGRRLDPRVERVLFALVANRALDASSKLAAADWISNDVHVAGLDTIDEQACYRAMDWLLQIEPALAREAYHRVTDLLNLEVDLLFFDTTSTYVEIDDADEPVARDEHGRALPDPGDPDAASRKGFRGYCNSKDHRDDLPQVVVGMAVTRDGIPVRVWSWPGGTADSELIRQARDDLRAWTVSKLVWVADRGFASAANRRHLMRGGGNYIIGERLRSGSAEAAQALARPGRYATVRNNLQVKEGNLGEGDRWIVCFNPAQADRDAQIRAKMIIRLEEAIAGSDRLGRDPRQLAGVLSTKPGLRIETVVNDTTDLGVLRRLEHFDELSAKARDVNRRMVDAERVGQGAVLASPAFGRIAHPSLVDGRRTPALRFGDPRVQALAGALAHTLSAATGITNRSLRARMPALLGGTGYTPPRPATT
jgi:hypothetical protein